MATPTWTIRPAQALDLPAVVGLLDAAGLPLEGLGDTRLHVAVSGGEVLGVVGLELRQGAALLRSLAVVEHARSSGLGRRLVAHALDLAAAGDIREVHLLTTTAADWFAGLGFTRVDRAALPEALLASAELQGACPESAEALVAVTAAGRTTP